MYTEVKKINGKTALVFPSLIILTKYFSAVIVSKLGQDTFDYDRDAENQEGKIWSDVKNPNPAKSTVTMLLFKTPDFDKFIAPLL